GGLLDSATGRDTSPVVRNPTHSGETRLGQRHIRFKRRPRWSPLPRPPGAFTFPGPMSSIEVITLTDAGQPAEQIARRAAHFLRPAGRRLERPLSDTRLPAPSGSIAADQLREASERGVAARLLYNVDTARPSEPPPPPRTRPDILAELP